MLVSSCKKGPEFTYTTDEVRRMDITTSVTATGTIEPVTKVDVGTQVSGIVSRLYVDYNSTVKAGQVIAELDRTNLLSELASAQAMQKSAQSDLAYQKLNYERFKALYEKGLVSTNDYDKAKLSYDQAKEAMVQRVESVKKAETNLSYATITSPIDGIVIKKEVEQGQTVASSFNTPTLFTIAQDLTQMRVVANEGANFSPSCSNTSTSSSVTRISSTVSRGTRSLVVPITHTVSSGTRMSALAGLRQRLITILFTR